ncbi:AAA family ATPase [uncultured Stenotrophomonas sp.]|uniref:ATP-dependent nuclease n=1 Tax=uncultured Stenotrophomonas sp. TaxID=165438 RepID=UPI0025F061AF|nr:AAA family ATPase [uncultured Stenotrophomonas sp.]
MPYRIDSIRPKHGPAIALHQLTVLVGPNNCGKSQTLRDIREFSNTGSLSRLVILEAVQVTLPTATELKSAVQIRPHKDAVGHIMVSAVKDDLQSQSSFGPQESWFDETFGPAMDSNFRQQEILRALGTCLIAYLGAEARFKLTESTAGFNTRSEAPGNALQSLFAADSAVITELRKAFKTAFGMDIGLDWGAMTRLYLRVAKDFGDIPDSREALDALMADAEELQKQGDGFRSFTGIALAMLAYPKRVILLDEPEAFLHPAQARVLGRWVAKQAALRPAQVVVATHSADFLAGLVGSGEAAKILRLNRGGLTTKFHEVPPAVTSSLIQSPLLSSQPVLDSMFHRGVVICEGDPDRAVYQTVAHRTSEQMGEDFLFIHSNGKDAAHSPAELLRQSGTPVCVITDFDVLNSEAVLERIVEGLTGHGLDEGTRTLRQQVAAAVEAKSEQQSYEELRASVIEWLEQSGDLRHARRSLVAAARAGSNKWDKAKKVGLAALPETEQARGHALLALLAGHGLFVVPRGSLESWLPLGVKKGSEWNRRALEQLYEGQCASDLRTFVATALSSLVTLSPTALSPDAAGPA